MWMRHLFIYIAIASLMTLPGFAQPQREASVSVVVGDDGAVAQNDFYRLEFGASGNIEALTFKATGRRISGAGLHNDALTLKPGTVYSLRKAESNLRVESLDDGGKQLIVNAIFMTGQENAADRPEIQYVYTFTPKSSLVRVQVEIHQSKPKPWALLRINELGFEGETNIFSEWATGDDPESGKIKTSVKGPLKSTNWKAAINWSLLISDKREVIGLFAIAPEVSRTFIYIYGANHYYLNGRYGEWDGQALQVEQYWYFGMAPNGYSGVCAEVKEKFLGQK